MAEYWQGAIEDVVFACLLTGAISRWGHTGARLDRLEQMLRLEKGYPEACQLTRETGS